MYNDDVVYVGLAVCFHICFQDLRFFMVNCFVSYIISYIQQINDNN